MSVADDLFIPIITGDLKQDSSDDINAYKNIKYFDKRNVLENEIKQNSQCSRIVNNLNICSCFFLHRRCDRLSTHRT